MKKIQMLDLAGQHNKIRAEIDEAIKRVVDSSQFINGPEVAAFANDLAAYTGAKYAIPCGNGTDAIQIALMSLQLRVGDEVIVPSFTYIAAAEAILLLGLKPVFVDVDEDTCNIDPALIERRITEKTRAIVPVHLFGQAVWMEEIIRIARQHQLYIIEDCAQSIGTEYYFSNRDKKQCGTIGDIGCLSFFPSKNLGCFGDGGALLTNDGALANRIKAIASHGQSVRYRHEITGVNSRLDTIQAAILQVKLRYLDQYTAARQTVAERYREQLSGLDDYINLPSEVSYSSHSYHQFTIRVAGNRRNELKEYLQQKEIPSMIYYPLSLPNQPVFASMRQREENDEVARRLAQSVLSLPMHTELDEEQIAYITDRIKTFFS